MSRQHEMPAESAWQDFVSRHSTGGVLTGQVVSVVPFGAFVEVAEGIHGLLHSVEVSPSPEVGTTVSVRIAAIDVERRRFSLVPA